MKEFIKKGLGPALFIFLVVGMLSGNSPQEKSKDKDKKDKAAGAALAGESSLRNPRNVDACDVSGNPVGDVTRS